ncbi:hypothetical protein DFJ74DRAFT_681221 [Hyaloraphidium curvatum]|nr:hypothetical protein DFJ74DRAFT_681221 [Hyaloraphidium curvatum]
MDSQLAEPGDVSTRKTCVLSWARDAFISAAEAGDLPTLLRLLPDIEPGATGALGFTALQAAAAAGRTEAVRVLLEDGRADPNARDAKGRTALYLACENDRVEAVGFLLADWRVDPGLGIPGSGLFAREKRPADVGSSATRKAVRQMLAKRAGA